MLVMSGFFPVWGVTMRKLNLLVLDDDPAIVRLISQILANSTFQNKVSVVSYTDPALAVTWINDHCCDIILTDFEMPNYSGTDIVLIAKQKNAWTQTLVLTGHSTWDRMSEAIEAGACDYLLKPINKGDVLRLVEQAVERHTRWQAAIADALTHRKSTHLSKSS
jgi:DNA-binding NtrC family response regulator